MAIALIDYGAGNLTSVRKGLAAVGADLFTPAVPAELARASAIVVPGVGHFGATAVLDDGWRNGVARAIASGTPVLGICLGMQWLFDGSDEAPAVRGLGLIAGTCRRIAAEPPLKVPHVGWNSLDVTRGSALLDGIDEGATVYFTHTFAAPVTEAAVATATHGETFCAAVSTGYVYGVQFHPEKSGPAGLRILRNFVSPIAHAL
jgi:glutamine amidotransferase